MEPVMLAFLVERSTRSGQSPAGFVVFWTTGRSEMATLKPFLEVSPAAVDHGE